MRVRRCAVLFIEAREATRFDIESILTGGVGLGRRCEWIAHAPHLLAAIEITVAERDALGLLSPSMWTSTGSLADISSEVLERLLEKGLVLSDEESRRSSRARDEKLRSVHWHPIGALMSVFTRWDSVDSVRSLRDQKAETALQLRDAFGPPPPHTGHSQLPLVTLPRIPPNDFDALLARRATCRNFDAQRKVPFQQFAQLLQRVFAAQAQVRVSDDLVFLKKNVPSGGGLHPMECYLIVQHVEGVTPGLYHYQATAHALEPLPVPEGRSWEGDGLRGFVMDMVAQQHWFADAHVLVILAPRFDRTFWKYRHHAKGYRVVALEAGHLSQTLYLSATEAGLGAFITGAINEVQIEEAFGLDPIHQGALAICGFGWRAQVMETAELDPAGHVWDARGSVTAVLGAVSGLEGESVAGQGG